ncbi:hypothetical protein IMSAGC003_01938 [Lachnospiraceae bacterium]|nr:hypothetical protein IMSAGC003_01938 [Lachnospiraceae bacterium]
MMNTDKAYILGLIIGGGIWGNAEDVFKIRLPFKQWGSYEANPKRAGEISRDVMKLVSPMFRVIYGISVSYDTSVSGVWNILCEGDMSTLRSELEGYGIWCEGEIRKHANISKIVPELVDDNLKRRFIAGLADTIGSTKRSHRRFNDDKQMVSFEISGFEFDFVCSLCKLLHSIGCYPDQILWNHPNFHCGSNPYDKRWKKGFKLRVYLDQYEKFGAFAFTSKVLSARENKKLEAEENVAIPCDEREIKLPSVTCVHCDEDSPLLPDVIRGGHYLHNRHVCAVLSCDHAPYGEVNKLLANAQYCINPFPVLVKGRISEIQTILASAPIYQNRTYRTVSVKIADLYGSSETDLLYSNGLGAGYPMNKVILALAYLIAAVTNQLNGLRPKGSKDTIIIEYLKSHPDAEVFIMRPDLFTPIVIQMGVYAALVGPNNPKVYKKLIQKCPDNPYKIKVRAITEADLK